MAMVFELDSKEFTIPMLDFLGNVGSSTVMSFFKRYDVDVTTDSIDAICKKTGKSKRCIKNMISVISEYDGIPKEQSIQDTIKSFIKAVKTDPTKIEIAPEFKWSAQDDIEMGLETDDDVYDKVTPAVKPTIVSSVSETVTNSESVKSTLTIPSHLIGKARRVTSIDWSKPTDQLTDKDYYDTMILINEIYGEIGKITATDGGPGYMVNAKFFKLIMSGELQKKLKEIKDALPPPKETV